MRVLAGTRQDPAGGDCAWLQDKVEVRQRTKKAYLPSLQFRAHRRSVSAGLSPNLPGGISSVGDMQLVSRSDLPAGVRDGRLAVLLERLRV